jgi:predicted RNA binding protein YcfA (HicA-like mRNA interferase family)
MNGRQLLRKLRRIGRERGIAVEVDSSHGRGSHSLVRFGDRTTTLPDLRRDVRPGLLSAIMRQLDLTREDLD